MRWNICGVKYSYRIILQTYIGVSNIKLLFWPRKHTLAYIMIYIKIDDAQVDMKWLIHVTFENTNKILNTCFGLPQGDAEKLCLDHESKWVFFDFLFEIIDFWKIGSTAFCKEISV